MRRYPFLFCNSLRPARVQIRRSSRELEPLYGLDMGISDEIREIAVTDVKCKWRNSAFPLLLCTRQRKENQKGKNGNILPLLLADFNLIISVPSHA